MNKTAVKSMLTLAMYLIVLIGGWAILAHLIFPKETEENKYAAFVKSNAPMLTQVAENAMDPEKWAGIRTVPEVVEMLEKGSITSVEAYDAGVSFVLPSTLVEGGLYICYDPSGDGFLNAAEHIYLIQQYPDEWTQIESTDKRQRWEGGMFGKGYFNIRRLADHFYLIDAYLPT